MSALTVSYYSASQRDNITLVQSNAGILTGLDYVLIRTEGYVYPAEQPSRANRLLRQFYRSAVTDNDLVGTTAGANQATAAGYSQVSTQGYAFPAAP